MPGGAGGGAYGGSSGVLAGGYAQAPPGQRYNSMGQLEKIPTSQSGVEPVTGSPSGYPTAGVDPGQQYNAATELKLQQGQQAGASALSKQNYDQSQSAADAMLQRIPQVMTGTGSQSGVTYGGGVSPQQSQAAVEAEFARAKDSAGQIAKSAITGLNDSMASRGLQGSGIQGEEMAKIIGGQAGGLSDLNREQAIQGLQYATHANDMQYQGDITQRGQNMGLTQSLLGLLRGGVAY